MASVLGDPPARGGSDSSGGAQFTRLRGLKCFAAVQKMFEEGRAISDIARFIQEEQGEYLNVTRKSLQVILTSYRRTQPMLPRAAPKAAIQRAIETVDQAVDKVEQGLNALHELQKLYELQMQRVGIGFEKEKMFGALLPTMAQEVRTSREILATYAELEMDLGIAKRHLGQLEVDAAVATDMAKRYGKDSVAKVIADPSSRKKVLGVVERLLQQANQGGVGFDLTLDIPIPPDTVPEEEPPATPVFPALQAIAVPEEDSDLTPEEMAILRETSGTETQEDTGDDSGE